ncbi:MAG: hypothetical protein R3F11_24080 [Verrucomicrobiales bacterium]
MIVAAQGRVHLYEGHPAREATAAIRFLAALGARRLVLTNAAGVVNPDFEPGGWMMIADHLNLTGTSPLLGGPNFIDMSETYTPAAAVRLPPSRRRPRHPAAGGRLCGAARSQYETPAEVRMLRALGADAVGMSTVLEADPSAARSAWRSPGFRA